MNNLENYAATLKAKCLAASKRSAETINDYWRQHGIDARAEIRPDGSITSRLDVSKHIPAPFLNAFPSAARQGRPAARSATGEAGIARGSFTKGIAR